MAATNEQFMPQPGALVMLVGVPNVFGANTTSIYTVHDLISTHPEGGFKMSGWDGSNYEVQLAVNGKMVATVPSEHVQPLPRFCIDPDMVGSGHSAYEIQRRADGSIAGRRRVRRFVTVWKDDTGVAWAVVQWEHEQGYEIVSDVGIGGNVRRLYTPALEEQDRANGVFF